MNVRRIMLAFSVFLILLLPALWFTAPLWLSNVAEYVLTRQPCSEAVVNIDAIGWHKSHINRLYCKDQKNTFEIDATDAEIGYSLAGLMNKRIENLTLKSVALQLRASSEAKPEAIPLLTTPALLLHDLPLSSFEISSIHIQRQNAAGTVLQELSGHANYADQSLSLALHEDAYLKELQFRVEMNQKNGISTVLYRGKSPILKIDSTVRKTDVGLSLDGTCDMQLAQLSTVLQPWLHMPKQQLEGRLHGSWQLSLPAQGSSESLLQQLSASTTLELDFALKRPNLSPSSGKVKLNVKLKQGAGIWHIAEKSQIKLGGKQAATIDLSGLSGSFALTGSGWRAAIAKNSDMHVTNIHLSDMRIPSLNIRFTRPFMLGMSLKGGLKLVKKTALTMAFPNLHWQGNSLSSRDIKLAIHRGSMLSPSGSFSASGIQFTSPTLKLPASNISGTFKLSEKQLSAKGKLIARKDGIHLNWKLNHQLLRQKGLLTFSFDALHFGATAIDLSQIVDAQGDYAIDKGSVLLSGRLQWQNGGKKHINKLDARVQLKLSNLKGHYKSNRFSGLDGELLINGGLHRLLMAPALITIQQLDVGVPISNISMKAAFRYPFAGLPSLEMHQLNADALAGHISSEKISIDLARASNPFVVRFSHLDVGKAVALRQQEGLFVKGTMDGELPFDWTRDGLKMMSGKMQATPGGGVIRYLGTESAQNLASTDLATKMVLEIMHNFHYKQLKVGADYQPDGELKMSIHLKGNNPDYKNGRSIVFNFNLEENLLKLLQGLGMAGDISDALEKKVQKTLRAE